MKKRKYTISQLVSCSIKERYESGGQAHRARKPSQGIYRCPCCNGFHLTSRRSRGRPQPKKLNPRQEAE